jgi:hypothetical protein
VVNRAADVGGQEVEDGPRLRRETADAPISIDDDDRDFDAGEDVDEVAVGGVEFGVPRLYLLVESGELLVG